MIRRLWRRLRRRLAPWLRPVRDAGVWVLQLPRLALGRPAGHFYYVFDAPPAGPFRAEVKLPGEGPGAVEKERAAAWCAGQTLGEVTAVGYSRSGAALWRVHATGPADGEEAAPWFAAPGRLPEVYPAFLESCLLAAAAERVDAVVLRERLPAAAGTPDAPARLLGAELRPYTLFSSAAYRYDPSDDAVEPRSDRVLVKAVDAAGVADLPRDAAHFNRFRRGPYLSSSPLPPALRLGVRDVSALARPPLGGRRPHVLVLLSFLAHGGVEHTLYETLRLLRDDYDFSIVTLAPHRPELGDRRREFEEITPRMYCLGDLLHPAAMYGIVLSLLDRTGARTLFNTNGTTLFYEIAPRLKADRPEVRVVDQLYDHRIGYITWYDRRILEAVDTCVAVNRRIAAELTAERGWPAERVPVIWPCGRRPESFPSPDERPRVRRELRRELGYEESDVVFLTAARMNAQKRPLDLVALAGRVRDLERVHFLIVGGGELEADVDAAIARAEGSRIRRLPFRTDIPELVVAADVGCLVSDFEGLPVFMMECFQGERPFLGTNVGDMGEVLRDSGGGLVVEEPGDLEGLEAAVRQLADAEARAELGERAREASAMFAPEACAEKYGELFSGRLGAR